MTLLRSVARPMLASVFFVGGVNALRNSATIAPKVEPIADAVEKTSSTRVSPQNLVRINAGVQLGAGAALATGRFPRLAALLLSISLTPTTAVGHQFWNQSDPDARKNQLLHFVKNLAIIGGLLMSTLDPDPHKKVLVRRAKDSVTDAAEAVGDRIGDLRR